jgi:lipopolysaccharide transport system permease protein
MRELVFGIFLDSLEKVFKHVIVRHMSTQFDTTSQYLNLLWAMTEREVKARYKQAIFGFLWVILNPLLQMLIIGTVFSYVFKTGIEDYFLFLFDNLVIWNFAGLTLSKVTPSIVYELSLIEKAKFPREVIPLSIVFANLFHTVITFVLLLPVLFVFGKLLFGHILLLPLILIWTTLITVGVGLGTAALNVRYRDIAFFVTAFLPLWFYGSPVLYSFSMVNERLKAFYFFNPMTSVLELTRWSTLGGSFPSGQLIFANLMITLVLFGGGVILFRRQAPFFDDWV